MSPEIILTEEFDLPTDIFSLGIILCEILARKLASDKHFKRSPPTFGIDEAEVHLLADPGCPPAFLTLALDCLNLDPAARPTTRVILNRLRDIEAEVLLRPSEADDLHVGSVKFMTGTGKRPGAGPRIPSFGVGVGKDIRGNSDGSEDSDEDELTDAMDKLGSVSINGTWSTTAPSSTRESFFSSISSSAILHLF
jgi:LIM domain kinase 1